MRIDYMQYDKHGRPIGIPGHLMCDHGAIRDECEICRRDVLIAELRARLEKAEARERTLWEQIPQICPSLEYSLKRQKNDLCGRTYKPCKYDTCPLRALREADRRKVEIITEDGS